MLMVWRMEDIDLNYFPFYCTIVLETYYYGGYCTRMETIVLETYYPDLLISI